MVLVEVQHGAPRAEVVPAVLPGDGIHRVLAKVPLGRRLGHGRLGDDFEAHLVEPHGGFHEEEDAPRILAERLRLASGQVDILGDNVHGVPARRPHLLRLGADIDGPKYVVRQFGRSPADELQQIDPEISHHDAPFS